MFFYLLLLDLLPPVTRPHLGAGVANQVGHRAAQQAGFLGNDTMPNIDGVVVGGEVHF